MPFKEGQSGNVKGRPVLSDEFKNLLHENTPRALNTLAEIMLNNKTRNFDRITAAKIILDKALGMNYQLYLEDDYENDTTIKVKIINANKATILKGNKNKQEED